MTAAARGRDTVPLDLPLEPETFARLMGPLGPFEPAPRLAAAVSGGSDSLALAILGAGWARAAGGSLTALVVDHRLREASGEEARHTAKTLTGYGIRAVILTRDGAAPETAIEAVAREARYRLMGEWCGANRVLHLLVGHQLNDQAETVLLRLAAGSGLDGLAAMPAIQETGWGRLLRPLLGVPPDRLRAMLRVLGLDWIEDPTNTDDAFARSRLRGSARILAAEGLAPARLATTAARIGAGRSVLEAQTAALLAAGAAVHPAGYARLDRSALAHAPADLAWRAIERVIRTIGAGRYPPRRERLTRLFAMLRDDAPAKTRTLGGCIIRPDRAGVLVAREPAAARQVVALDAGGDGEVFWDCRFRLRLASAARTRRDLRIAALGAAGLRAVTAQGPFADGAHIPATARPSLPALHDRRGVLEVPHLGYNRVARGGRDTLVESVYFCPPHPLAAAEFSVV